MSQSEAEDLHFEPMILHHLWKDHEVIHVPMEKGGHGGGDKRLHDKIFKNSESVDPYGRAAGVRDGAMSILIGIAARRSIETKQPVKINSLTDLEPKAVRS